MQPLQLDIEDEDGIEGLDDADNISPLLMASEERMETETDDNAVNPLVTPGLTDTSNQRCSLFDANSYRSKQPQQMARKTKNQKQ